MKITDPNGRSVSVGPSNPKSVEGGGGWRSGYGGASRNSDEVALSGLSGLVAAVSADSPGYVAKLSSLTATISNGTYQIDAGMLSNHIIEASLIPGNSYA